MTSILLVDSQADIPDQLAQALRACGYDVFVTPTHPAMPDLAAQPDIVLLDARASQINSRARLAALRTGPLTATAPLLLLTNQTDELTDPDGAADLTICGPIELDDLRDGIAALLRVRRSIVTLRTQTRQLTARLEDATMEQRQVHESDRKKDEFLSVIAHDLKNPMASIKGYADLMRRRLSKTPGDPNIKGLDIISQQIVRMTDLLDHLLDFSRINLNRLQLQTRQADLASFIQQVVEDAQIITNQQRIELQISDSTLVADIDSSRIGQAIKHLLNNAIKFSPESRPIAVHVERRSEAGRPMALIAVSDQGIGIPEKEQQYLFEQFFRASNGGEASGVGLGLFMAHAIVTRHGGHMLVESGENRGSTFSIMLPLIEDHATRRSQPAEQIAQH